ncbi:MAG TPA: ABC transporter ATP-binding protein [Candidatus Limnocylindrales bacterium]|nr:ABC transporter ATP-binding protein [Candidatus Limnocylindrales bacterium]
MTGRGLSVDVRGLGLAYRGRTVLSGVDLHLDPGESVCLVGPNGAGKSSLLRCLTRLVDPTAGSIALDGRPLRDIERAALARTISVVPGQVELPFSMRVEEVVGLGRIPHEHPLSGPDTSDHQAVDAAIRRVGIDGLRGRDVQELSMGERQLVLVAMAVAQSGRMIVLDEPTVHLDLRHQVEVLSLLARLSADGVTVLAVLHDLPLAAHFFSRLVLLDSGRVVADGPPSEVLAPARIRDVYGVDPRFVPALA